MRRIWKFYDVLCKAEWFAFSKATGRTIVLREEFENAYLGMLNPDVHEDEKVSFINQKTLEGWVEGSRDSGDSGGAEPVKTAWHGLAAELIDAYTDIKVTSE